MYGLFKWVLCSLCLMLFNQGITQVIDAGSLNLSKNSFITKKVEVFRSLKNLPFDSIIRDDYGTQFKDLQKEVHITSIDPYYYWFRFIVKNSETIPKTLVLLMGPIGMKDSELFQKNKSKWKSIGKTGIKYPFIERLYQYTHFAFPIKLDPVVLDTFYLSIDYDHEVRSYAFALLEEKKVMQIENNLYFLFGIIIGLLSLFLAFNLYLFFTIKEKIHFWYSVYILMLILVVLKNDGLDAEFLGWDSEQGYRLSPLMTVGALSIAVLMHVVQLFLLNIQRSGLLFKITLAVKWTLFVSAIAYMITFYYQPGLAMEETVFHWARWNTIAGIVVILVNAVYSVIKGFRGALFILVGLAVFFVGAMERLLLLSTASYLFPPNLFHIGMILETFIISFALIYRYNLDRKVKFEALQEKIKLQAILEKQILESRLEMQEQTFKNLSQEIHDNIGQLISIAKLNVSTLDADIEGDSSKEIGEVKQLLTDAGQDLRNLSKRLNPDFIQEMGLLKSMELESDLIRKSGLSEVFLKTKGEFYRFNPQRELILFRICQEAVNYFISALVPLSITINVLYEVEKLTIDISAKYIPSDSKTAAEKLNMELNKIENMINRAKSIAADLTSYNRTSESGIKLTISTN